MVNQKQLGIAYYEHEIKKFFKQEKLSDSDIQLVRHYIKVWKKITNWVEPNTHPIKNSIYIEPISNQLN